MSDFSPCPHGRSRLCDLSSPPFHEAEVGALTTLTQIAVLSSLFWLKLKGFFQPGSPVAICSRKSLSNKILLCSMRETGSVPIVPVFRAYKNAFLPKS